jgi:hypothetical protein
MSAEFSDVTAKPADISAKIPFLYRNRKMGIIDTNVSANISLAYSIKPLNRRSMRLKERTLFTKRLRIVI